jgi:UDP-N-acetylglucosamine:LPS N-acetylglucosamine transferase
MQKILAVASGGGHWKELMLLKDGFDFKGSSHVKYITTISGLPQEESIHDFEIIKDSNKTQKLALIISFFQIFVIYLKYRPNIVISTGAAAGIVSIIIGKICGAKTIWVDSIANADKLSLSGDIAKWTADIVLTQWEHLADGKDIQFHGSVF